MPSQYKLPEITVHGRFQPPLHVNHWEYIRQGFDRAEHVTVLITNPFGNEAFDETASWRNDPANNPFSFDERNFMFKAFFKAMGIPEKRYAISPFNIKDPAAFSKLDPGVPNLVNVYSPWSGKKVELFSEQGLEVIRLDLPKSVAVSGTKLREIIAAPASPAGELGNELVAAGFMAQAVPGLLEVLGTRTTGR